MFILTEIFEKLLLDLQEGASACLNMQPILTNGHTFELLKKQLIVQHD